MPVGRTVGGRLGRKNNYFSKVEFGINCQMAQSEDGFGPQIPCGCGCGKTMTKFDRNGRERKYLNGHYMKFIQKLAESTGALKRE